jgi:hypothetical protein
MKILSLLILSVTVLGQISFAADSKNYRPGECIENLVSVLGPNFKYVSRSIVTRLEKNGDLIVLNSNGLSVKVQPNGGCYPVKNKMDDFSTAMTSAYTKAKSDLATADKKSEETGDPVNLQGHPTRAIESCDAQEKNSDWYKIATQLIPTLQTSGSKRVQ